MKSVVYGNSVTFSKSFSNSVGEYVDPLTVEFSIVKDVNTILYGPYVYSNSATPHTNKDGFMRLGIGTYCVTQLIESVIVPGFYSAKWKFEVDNVTEVYYENFQVVEPLVASSRIVDPTIRYGIIYETPIYNDLSLGETDRLVLIGHCDGLEINEPHRVINLKETLNILGADSDSPIVRGLLEAYNSGAKDIWIVASAPMAEYMPFDYTNPNGRNLVKPEFNNLTFYQRYAQRLDDTYSMLRTEDFPEIVVPLEASFYGTDDVDFLTPLLANCLERYRTNGSVSIGILGSRIGFDENNIFHNLSTDPRVSTLKNGEYIYSTQLLYSILRYHYGINLFSNNSRVDILDGQDLGKFGMVVIGEGVMNVPQIDSQYTTSIATSVAALLAKAKINESIVHTIFPRISNLVGYKFTKDEVKSLAQKRINVATLTPLGNRGNSYQSYLATDNTLANGFPEGMPDDQTPFWSISILRLISKISRQIVTFGRRRLGTIEYAQFNQEINEYLLSLQLNGVIRDYSLNIYRIKDENRTVYVDLVINPFFPLREIYFTVKVGPGTGE